MAVPEYHNTNRESGSILSESKRRANVQQEAVLQFFVDNPKGFFSRAQINEFVLPGVPYTSICRALWGLVELNQLVKTSHMIMGEYGKMVHTWRMRRPDDKWGNEFPGDAQARATCPASS